MERLWQNLRYTVRVLGKNPGFTVVAVLSLALGIGANAAIFTLINALLLRNLPVYRPGRLVGLSAIRQNHKVPFSFPMFRELDRGQRVFSGLTGWSAPVMFNVKVNGAILQSETLAVTGNYYSVLGVAPLLGRLLTSEDVSTHTGSAYQVAVISYGFWQREFGGMPDVIGKRIYIEDQPFAVMGVTRNWFTGMTTGVPPDITVPITAYPLIRGGTFGLDDRSVLWVSVTGRLKDGMSLEQARAQLESFWPDVLLATAPTQAPGPRRQTFLSMLLDLSTAGRGVDTFYLRTQFSRPLYILAGIVGLILLVACVNLANLMLARAAARSLEMSVRIAIGASRSALVSQVLTESLTLSLGGVLLGLCLSYWGSRALVILMTEGTVSFDLRPDLRVLSAAALVAIVTGVLFGLVPALLSSRQDPASVLQRNPNRLASGVGPLSKSLVVVQVALSLVLLLGAGLLLRSFQRLLTVDLGFKKENVLEIILHAQPRGYQNVEMNSYHKQLLERISGIPGVRSAGLANVSIPSPQPWQESVSPVPPEATTPAMASQVMVWPGLFGTLGIRVIRGRDFEETDDDRHPSLAVISRSLADRLFPNGEAVGNTIRFGVMPDFQNLQIIGIVANARILDPRDATPPLVYLSYLQFPKAPQGGTLYVVTNKAPEALARTVGHEVELLGHEYPLRAEPIEQIMSLMLTNERITALLSGFFAVFALLLASIGLYGLMSYAVTCRIREIGVRIALGALRGNVLWVVLRETLTLALLGITLGVPCALAAARLMNSMLFGLSPNDFPTISAVSLLLLLVALFAGYLPARRACAIDPIVALRTE